MLPDVGMMKTYSSVLKPANVGLDCYKVNRPQSNYLRQPVTIQCAVVGSSMECSLDAYIHASLKTYACSRKKTVIVLQLPFASCARVDPLLVWSQHATTLISILFASVRRHLASFLCMISAPIRIWDGATSWEMPT